VAVRADSLNLNELIPAITKGAIRSSRRADSDAAIDSLTDRLIPPRLLPPDDDKKRSRTLMPTLPARINALVSIDASDVAYDGVTFDESHGRVMLADRSLYLSNLFVDSELGNVEVGFNYLASDSTLARAEAGVRIARLDVDRVIDLFPDLHRMVPPLRSLRGEVGCELFASADIDSTFYLTLPTLAGSAELTGSNLAVAKAPLMPKFVGRLLFGRNPDIEVDTLAVRLSLAHDVASLYPFELDVNHRYRVLLTGIQDEHGAFYYHAALLRWFLPFRLGGDFYQADGRRRFRLARPRVKSAAKVARLIGIDASLIYPTPDAGRAVDEGFDALGRRFDEAEREAF
jgi:hypothetical protein